MTSLSGEICQSQRATSIFWVIANEWHNFCKKKIILDLFLFRPGVLWFFACPGSKGSKSQLEKRVFPA